MSTTAAASASDAPDAARYRVTGMDCPSCAAKIEKAARGAGRRGGQRGAGAQAPAGQGWGAESGEGRALGALGTGGMSGVVAASDS